MDRLGCIWDKVTSAADGFKTLGVSVIFFALGLADYLDVVNVKPMLDYLLGDDKASKVMIFMPIIFATLRFLTKDRVRFMRRHDADPDECNQPTEH